MAELATIARPYAEAVFKAVSGDNAAQLAEQVSLLGQVAADADVRQFADNPRATTAQVVDLVQGVTGVVLDPKVANLLQLVVENGRLNALPEIAAQFKALVNAQSGASDAIIESAFAVEGQALAELVAALERRFGRKLHARVDVKPELIGGVRVVVGDEVLDTSVKARLEQMKVALTA
jgi:F-type H+-transporting ATPase subunit delta